MDFWDFWDFLSSALALLFAAVVAAYLARYFNQNLMKFNHRWEEHRHLIISAEKFCDELLEHVVSYQQTDSSDAKAKILSGQISISVQLITQFIKENFIRDDRMKLLLLAIIDTVTNHDTQDNPSDQDWVARSAGLIIELRFAFSSAKLARD